MENNKNKIKLNTTITVLGVAILTMATIGASFAYFTALANTTEQEVKTGSLTLKATSEKLNATNIKPTNWDDEVLSNNVANTNIAQVKLSVNTYGTTIDDAKYNIFLTTSGIELNEDENLEGGLLSDIKWKLIDASNNIIGSGDFSDGDYTEVTQINEEPIKINNKANTEEDGTDSFILFVYIDDNGKQDQLQNLSIYATLSAKAIQ